LTARDAEPCGLDIAWSGSLDRAVCGAAGVCGGCGQCIDRGEERGDATECWGVPTCACVHALFIWGETKSSCTCRLGQCLSLRVRMAEHSRSEHIFSRDAGRRHALLSWATCRTNSVVPRLRWSAGRAARRRLRP